MKSQQQLGPLCPMGGLNLQLQDLRCPPQAPSARLPPLTAPETQELCTCPSSLRVLIPDLRRLSFLQPECILQGSQKPIAVMACMQAAIPNFFYFTIIWGDETKEGIWQSLWYERKRVYIRNAEMLKVNQLGAISNFLRVNCKIKMSLKFNEIACNIPKFIWEKLASKLDVLFEI